MGDLYDWLIDWLIDISLLKWHYIWIYEYKHLFLTISLLNITREDFLVFIKHSLPLQIFNHTTVICIFCTSSNSNNKYLYGAFLGNNLKRKRCVTHMYQINNLQTNIYIQFQIQIQHTTKDVCYLCHFNKWMYYSYILI